MDSEGHRRNPGTRVLRPLVHVGTRAAATTLRPLTPIAEAAAKAGRSLERQAVDRLRASDELERAMTAAIDSPQVQAALRAALESDGAKRLVDAVFDSGLLDRFVERLLVSQTLWDAIDEIAGSPAVTAAISQQGLGFADQVGEGVRERSRRADDRVERAARRLLHRQPRPVPPELRPSDR